VPSASGRRWNADRRSGDQRIDEPRGFRRREETLNVALFEALHFERRIGVLRDDALRLGIAEQRDERVA
jgi:hypothetical protein